MTQSLPSDQLRAQSCGPAWPALVALVLALSACGSHPQGHGEPPPEIARPPTEGLLPAVRGAVEKAYSAVEARPASAAAAGELGMLLHAHQQYAAAEAAYRRAAALSPREFKWLYYLGQVRASQGKYDEALASLDAALQIRPDYRPCLLKAGDVLMQLGRPEDAASYYRRAVDADAGSAAAWFGLGRVHSAKGDVAGAARAFERACSLYPEYGAAHYGLAVAYRRLGRLEEARPHFRLSRRYQQKIPPANDELMAEIRRHYQGAVKLIELAIALEREGKLTQALRLHLRALEIDPGLAQAHVNLISLYGRLGEREKAEEHYRLAMKLNPDMADCHYNHGVLLFEEERFDEAEAAFRKAIEINPFYAGAHHNLGVLLESRGDVKEAEAHYRLAVENRPGFALAHFHLGRLLVIQGRYGEGIRQLTAAVENEKAPGALYCYTLGAAYARAGDQPQAERYLRLALQRARAGVDRNLLSSIERDLERLGRRRPGG